MSEMRRHLNACASCATLDTRIRRSLLVVRNLPQIEPSADFFVRLSVALQQAPPPERSRHPFVTVAAVTAFTAALAAAVYFAMAIAPNAKPAVPAAQPSTALVTPVAPVPMSEVAIAATAPAGVPVWPAMFMVGELPNHLTSARILDSASGQ
jgi:hypothetical protein